MMTDEKNGLRDYLASHSSEQLAAYAHSLSSLNERRGESVQHRNEDYDQYLHEQQSQLKDAHSMTTPPSKLRILSIDKFVN